MATIRFHKLKIVIFSVLCLFMCFIISVKSEAQARSGIMNNGLSGINIDINSSPFTDYAAIPNWGQYAYTQSGCAWFASARVKQLTGKGTTIYSGSSWYNSAYSSCGFSRGSEIKTGALICWSGHVAFCEKIEGNTVYLSEGGQSYYSDEAHGYCVIRSVNLSSVKGLNSGFIGCVYTGYTPTQPDNVSFDNTVAKNISKEDATISTWVSNNGTISEYGYVIGSSESSYIRKLVSRNNITWTRFLLEYKLSENFGYLTEGQTYKCYFYVIRDGKEYDSNTITFTTLGNRDISFDTYSSVNVSNNDCNAEFEVWFSNTGAKEISSIGFMYGNSWKDMKTVEVISSTGNWTRVNLHYNLNKYGVILEPGKYYFFQFYVKVGNVIYRSDYRHFETYKYASFDTTQANNISSDSAEISTWISCDNTKHIDSVGFYIGSDENNLERYETGSNINGTRALLTTNVNDYIKLSGDKTYYFRFYAKIGNAEYLSAIADFKTKPGIAPTAPPTAESTPTPDSTPILTPEPTPTPGLTSEPTPTAEPTAELMPTAEPLSTKTPVLTRTPISIKTPVPAKSSILKGLKLSSVKCAKRAKSITGKVSVSETSVKIKVGKKAYREASVKGKKFTLKLNYRLVKKTKVVIKVEKNGYKRLIKSYTVK